MTHTLIVSPQALDDIRRNAGWMARRFSARSADRWLAGAEAAVQKLAVHPEQYPEADEAGDLGIDLRVRFHGRRPHVFRILFTIDGDVVNVHHVRHAAQDRLTADDI